MNPRKSQSLELCQLAVRSKVPCESPSTITAASISSEPAIV
jgi:hypothetical protein